MMMKRIMEVKMRR